MFEYVVSAGEGTMLHLGQCEFMDLADVVDDLDEGQTVSIAPVDARCETGK